MSGEQFYINYSLNGEHYIVGPYHTRRFAMSHLDDRPARAGAENYFSQIKQKRDDPTDRHPWCL